MKASAASRAATASVVTVSSRNVGYHNEKPAQPARQGKSASPSSSRHGYSRNTVFSAAIPDRSFLVDMNSAMPFHLDVKSAYRTSGEHLQFSAPMCQNPIPITYSCATMQKRTPSGLSSQLQDTGRDTPTPPKGTPAYGRIWACLNIDASTLFSFTFGSSP